MKERTRLVAVVSLLAFGLTAGCRSTLPARTFLFDATGPCALTLGKPTSKPTGLVIMLDTAYVAVFRAFLPHTTVVIETSVTVDDGEAKATTWKTKEFNEKGKIVHPKIALYKGKMPKLWLKLSMKVIAIPDDDKELLGRLAQLPPEEYTLSGFEKVKLPLRDWAGKAAKELSPDYEVAKFTATWVSTGYMRGLSRSDKIVFAALYPTNSYKDLPDTPATYVAISRSSRHNMPRYTELGCNGYSYIYTFPLWIPDYLGRIFIGYPVAAYHALLDPPVRWPLLKNAFILNSSTDYNSFIGSCMPLLHVPSEYDTITLTAAPEPELQLLRVFDADPIPEKGKQEDKYQKAIKDMNAYPDDGWDRLIEYHRPEVLKHRELLCKEYANLDEAEKDAKEAADKLVRAWKCCRWWAEKRLQKAKKRAKKAEGPFPYKAKSYLVFRLLPNNIFPVNK